MPSEWQEHPERAVLYRVSTRREAASAEWARARAEYRGRAVSAWRAMAAFFAGARDPRRLEEKAREEYISTLDRIGTPAQRKAAKLRSQGRV